MDVAAMCGPHRHKGWVFLFVFLTDCRICFQRFVSDQSVLWFLICSNHEKGASSLLRGFLEFAHRNIVLWILAWSWCLALLCWFFFSFFVLPVVGFNKQINTKLTSDILFINHHVTSVLLSLSLFFYVSMFYLLYVALYTPTVAFYIVSPPFCRDQISAFCVFLCFSFL